MAFQTVGSRGILRCGEKIVGGWGFGGWGLGGDGGLGFVGGGCWQDARATVLEAVFAEAVGPAGDVAEDFFAAGVVHEEVVGVGVVVVGAGGGFGDSGDEAADVGIGVEVVFVAVEDEGGHAEGRGAVVHSADVFSEGAEEAEGVLFDVVGVGFGLSGVGGGLGHLDVLAAADGVEGDAGVGEGGGGDLDEFDFPLWDVVAEADDGG